MCCEERFLIAALPLRAFLSPLWPSAFTKLPGQKYLRCEPLGQIQMKLATDLLDQCTGDAQTGNEIAEVFVNEVKML